MLLDVVGCCPVKRAGTIVRLYLGIVELRAESSLSVESSFGRSLVRSLASLS